VGLFKKQKETHINGPTLMVEIIGNNKGCCVCFLSTSKPLIAAYIRTINLKTQDKIRLQKKQIKHNHGIS